MVQMVPLHYASPQKSIIYSSKHEGRFEASPALMSGTSNENLRYSDEIAFLKKKSVLLYCRATKVTVSVFCCAEAGNRMHPDTHIHTRHRNQPRKAAAKGSREKQPRKAAAFLLLSPKM